MEHHIEVVDKLRILVVMTRFPYPPRTGSTIVALNHIKHLAKRHNIHVVCCGSADGAGELAQHVDALEFVSKPVVGPVQSLIRNLFNLLLGIPVFVTKNRCREMRRKIEQIANDSNPDVILLFDTGAIQYLPADWYESSIVNIEDPPSLKYDRMYELAALPVMEKMKILLSRRAIARFENRVLPRMARVLLLSQSDVDDMREESGLTNLAYVSYGISQPDPDKLLDISAREPGSIVFSGTMSHPPNIDAALYFLSDIFPAVIERFPSVRLWIVGNKPDPRILSAASSYGDRVKVTGRVDDITEYIRRAKISVCPIRLKIGVQTKILEALSWGTPVVTTEAGNSGIGAISGRHLWVDENPASFARHVVDLLEGKEWARLSEAGKTFVTSRNTWDASVARLEQEIRSLNTSVENDIEHRHRD
jgi:glycosyltransferase involved in cell wall biosynthesis